jgi:hypothetical protein
MNTPHQHTSNVRLHDIAAHSFKLCRDSAFDVDAPEAIIITFYQRDVKIDFLLKFKDELTEQEQRFLPLFIDGMICEQYQLISFNYDGHPDRTWFHIAFTLR